MFYKLYLFVLIYFFIFIFSITLNCSKNKNTPNESTKSFVDINVNNTSTNIPISNNNNQVPIKNNSENKISKLEKYKDKPQPSIEKYIEMQFSYEKYVIKNKEPDTFYNMYKDIFKEWIEPINNEIFNKIKDPKQKKELENIAIKKTYETAWSELILYMNELLSSNMIKKNEFMEKYNTMSNEEKIKAGDPYIIRPEDIPKNNNKEGHHH